MVEAYPAVSHPWIDGDRVKTIQYPGVAKTTTGDRTIHLLLVCPRMVSHHPRQRDANPRKTRHVAQKIVIALMIMPVGPAYQLVLAELVIALEQ